MEWYPKGMGNVVEDTKSVQEALDACGKAGGGTVVLDGSYLCGTLALRPNLCLFLAKGTVLKASGDLKDYYHQAEVDSPSSKVVGTPVLRKPAYPFIFAKDCPNVTISGEGRIDGNCYAFVKRVSKYYVTGSFYPRPTLLYLEHCDHLTVKDVVLADAPFWTLHVAGSDDVAVTGIRILNPLDVANCDGIDPDHCSNVRISNCHITCADDCICLKNTMGNSEYPGTHDVVISDCTLTSTSGALKIGTEGVADFTDILVHHCVIDRSNRGITIQVRDKGNVRNVLFDDILIRTRRFSEDWWGSAEPIAITSFSRTGEIPSGTISQMRFSHIRAEGENGVLVACDPGKVRDITFDDVSVMLCETSKWEKGVHDLRPRPQTEMQMVKAPCNGFDLLGGTDLRFHDCRFEKQGESPAFANACNRTMEGIEG